MLKVFTKRGFQVAQATAFQAGAQHGAQIGVNIGLAAGKFIGASMATGILCGGWLAVQIGKEVMNDFAEKVARKSKDRN